MKLQLLLAAALLSIAHAQIKYIPSNDSEKLGLPFAKVHNVTPNARDQIALVDVTAVSLDAFVTVNPQPRNATVAEKDDASIESKLGFQTSDVKTFNFEGFIDTELVAETVYCYILVDDVCDVVIQKIGSSVLSTVTVGRGALWRDAGRLTKIAVPLDPSSQYSIKIKYKNTAHLDYADGAVDVDGISLYIASENANPGALDVTLAPEYVFANAVEYATPISFSVKGLEEGQTAFIRQARVRFFNPGSVREHRINFLSAIDNTKVFRADAEAEGNGEETSYTAYIDADDPFKGTNLPDNFNGIVKNDTSFVVEIYYSKVIDGVIQDKVFGLVSEPDDIEAQVILFADEDHDAYGLPIINPVSHDFTYEESEVNKALSKHKESRATYATHATGTSHNGIHRAFTPLYQGRNVTEVKAKSGGNGIEIIADLHDEGSFNSTIFDRGHSRIGIDNYFRGYIFFASYGGKVIEGLSKPSMDLDKLNAEMQTNLYDKLTYKLTGIKTSGGDQALAKGVAIVGRGMAVVGVFLTFTGVGTIPGAIITVVGSSLSIVDFLSGPAEVNGAGHLHKALWSQSPLDNMPAVLRKEDEIIIFDPVSPAQAERSKLIEVSLRAQVGFSYMAATNGSITSEVNSGFGVTDKGYKVTLDLKGEDADDWKKGTVKFTN
jgi:hypothetical protein